MGHLHVPTKVFSHRHERAKMEFWGEGENSSTLNTNQRVIPRCLVVKNKLKRVDLSPPCPSFLFFHSFWPGRSGMGPENPYFVKYSGWFWCNWHLGTTKLDSLKSRPKVAVQRNTDISSPSKSWPPRSTSYPRASLSPRWLIM